MFRPRRERGDEVVKTGDYKNLEKRLQERDDHRNIPTVVFYPFDSYTDQGPYIGLANRLASGGVLHYSSCLINSGFDSVRAVLRQHNPNVRASESKINGEPIEQVEISAMSIHTKDVYDIVEDAYQMEERPLITLGGPAAKYEPHMFFGTKNNPNVGVDVAVTGEAYTGLALKEMILNRRKEMSNGKTASMREAFEDLASKRELDVLPGIMYRWKDKNGKTWLVDTHVGKGVKDLSEYPTIERVFEKIEKRHKNEYLLKSPASLKDIKKQINVVAVENTRGCRIHCDYCPLTDGELGIYRVAGFRNLGNKLAKVWQKTGIARFFGADDNIGNDIEQLYKDADGLSQFLLEDGRLLGAVIKNGSEITLTDLDRFAKKFPDGLRKLGAVYDGLWMGNEDVNQELIRKGQDLRKARDRFREMINAGIAPHVMNIYGDQMEYTRLRSNSERERHQNDEFLSSLSPHQLRLFKQTEAAMNSGKIGKSDRLARKFVESLTPSQEDNFKFGLREEVFFYLKYGAVSQQFTMLTPAVGTEVYDTPYANRQVFSKVGGIDIEPHHFDGNHIVITSREKPAERTRDVINAYKLMYNP
ncbi:MAG: hypothetical protein AABY22_25945, partial [Nanoarchaeota archaeon]